MQEAFFYAGLILGTTYESNMAIFFRPVFKVITKKERSATNTYLVQLLCYNTYKANGIKFPI